VATDVIFTCGLSRYICPPTTPTTESGSVTEHTYRLRNLWEETPSTHGVEASGISALTSTYHLWFRRLDNDSSQFGDLLSFSAYRRYGQPAHTEYCATGTTETGYLPLATASVAQGCFRALNTGVVIYGNCPRPSCAPRPLTDVTWTHSVTTAVIQPAS
jgi:hypothetical protein